MKGLNLNTPKSVRRTVLFLGGLFAVLFITSFFPSLYLFRGMDYSILNLLVRAVLIGLTPVLFVPVIYWISVRKPIFKNWKNIVLHGALSIVFCLLFLLLFQLLIFFFNGGEFFFGLEYNAIESILVRQFFSIGTILFFTYWGLVVLLGLDKYYKDLEAIQQKSNELESQLQLATLSSLRAQLKPHFLFNTLSMVDQMITETPSQAVEVIQKLENLLRNTFDRSSSESCTIAEEVAFIREYLAIEQSRFHDRLEVVYAINPKAKNIHVPRYLLQPLVENALVHGVGKTMEKCTVKISIDLADDQLTLGVKDDGPGIRQRSVYKSKGIGLKNVRERIKLYFGNEAQIDIHPAATGGAISEIIIPQKYLTENTPSPEMEDASI